MTAEPTIAPVRPLADSIPCIPAALVDSINRLVGRKGPWSMSVAGREVTITWQEVTTPPMEAARRCAFTIGAHHGVLGIPSACLDWLAPGSSRDPRWDGLDAAALVLLLDIAAHELWAALDVTLAAPMGFGGEPAAGNILHEFSVSVREDAQGIEHVFHVGLDAGACQRLAQTLPIHAAQIPDPPWVAGLTLPLAVVAGYQHVSLSEWAGLRAGDIVMLERAAGHVLACAAGRALFEIRPGPSGVTVIGPLCSFPRGSTMDITSGSADGVCPVDRLPVELVFELARMELTVADLRQCTEGTILSLAGHLGEVVDIRVHGQRIGKGSLVCIGDGLGVRIARLNHGD
jgi:type III secretion protein Q